MRTLLGITLLLLCCVACNSESEENAERIEERTTADARFDQTKWKVKDGSDYPYRDQMLNDLLYNDSVRTLVKYEIIALLGEPDRTNEGHLYYMVAQKRLGAWPLHTKTLVIKLSEDNTIDWMKVHE